MDRGSGTLSKQMADFVIVCIIRQYTRASAKKSEKGEVTCGLSLSPLHQSTFIICPHLLLLSIHLLKNTFPYLSVCFSLRMSVCLSVCSSISICLPVSLCVYKSFVCPSFCMSVPLRLLLVPQRLCTDEHVIVAFSGLTRAASAEKQHIYSQRCNCSDCVLCPVITERI